MNITINCRQHFGENWEWNPLENPQNSDLLDEQSENKFSFHIDREILYQTAAE